MSRVGAGWAARWGTVAVVMGVAVSGLVGVSPAQAAGSYQLLVSASADRSAATPLDGATVSGNIYAFTSPETSVLKSVFYIDDPTASGTLFHSEGTAPYDVNGGSVAAAAPYDTHALSDGTHTITQVVTNTAKVVETDTATFIVNNSVALPPTPTGVTAISGNGYVDLTWAAASGSTVGFNVYRGTSSAVSLSGTPLNGGALLTGTSFHDATVTNGTTYYYVVQSVDNGGRHSEAAAVQGKPVAPPATPPYVLQVSTSPDRSSPASLDGSTVQGSVYVFTAPETSVKRSDFWLDNTAMSGTPTHSESTGPFDFVGGSAAAATPWDTTALTNGTHTVTQQVTTTTNVVYVFTASFTVNNVAVPPPPPPPAAPTNVKATAGNGAVDLSWDAASGSTVGFNVYRGSSTPVSITGTPLNGSALITGSSFHDGTATNGQFWYYVVQSVDSIGQHSEAHSVSAKPTAPPVGPAYLVTLSQSADRSAGVNLDGVVVSGDAYIFTSPATSVKTVQFWLDDTAMAGPVTRNETTAPYDFIGGSPAAATPYDTHVLADGVHTITQKVTTTANVVVTTTATFKVVNSQLPPPAPTGVSVKAGNGVVDLSWNAKTGTTAGFNVYRGTSSNVSLGGTALNGASLLTGTSFHDASVTNGTTYYYVVQSVDVIGRHTEGDTWPATPNPPGPQQVAVTPSPLVLSTASGTTSSTLTASITNVGGATLTVSAAGLSGGDAAMFSLTGAPSFPLTLTAGQSATVGLRFQPTSTGTKGTTLTVSSNDPATPNLAIPVRGLALAAATSEPSLQQIFDTYQIPDSTGDPTPADIYLPTTAPLGDEVTVQAFAKAGAGPVTVTPLAVYDGQAVDPNVRVGWAPEAQAFPRTDVLSVPGSQNRTLQVQASGTGSFDPGSKIFGLYAAFPGRVSYQDDTLNAGVGGSMPRQVRVYPFRTAGGATVANTWVVTFEDFLGASPTSTSGEWNDMVGRGQQRARRVLRRPQRRRQPVQRPARDVAHRVEPRSVGLVELPRHGHCAFHEQRHHGSLHHRRDGDRSVPARRPDELPGERARRWHGRREREVHRAGCAQGPDRFADHHLRRPDPTDASARSRARPGSRRQAAATSRRSRRSWRPRSGSATVITKPGESINTLGEVKAVGDEVLSKFWQRADSSLPVSVRQIAGYAGQQRRVLLVRAGLDELQQPHERVHHAHHAEPERRTVGLPATQLGRAADDLSRHVHPRRCLRLQGRQRLLRRHAQQRVPGPDVGLHSDDGLWAPRTHLARQGPERRDHPERLHRRSRHGGLEHGLQRRDLHAEQRQAGLTVPRLTPSGRPRAPLARGRPRQGSRPGTSLTTSEPAATTAPSPMVTPLRTVAPLPIQT